MHTSLVLLSGKTVKKKEGKYCNYLQSFAVESHRLLNLSLFSFNVCQIIQWICMSWA